MNPLLHNPIADMYGPTFLALYAVVIVSTLVLCVWGRHRGDRSRWEPPLSLPPDPDPLETAYLRGGVNEVARVMIFDLLQRGYLRVVTPPKRWFSVPDPGTIERHPEAPPPRLLRPIEREVMDWFSVGRAAKDVFESRGLATRLAAHCAGFEETLQRERLLTDEGARAWSWKVGGAGGAVILGLGLYKLLIALAKGRFNVGFLVVLGVTGLVLLAALCRPQRLSARGRNYLQRLQETFRRLQMEKARLGLMGPDPRLVLLVSLFGVGMLQGTAHDAYRRMFMQPSSGGCGGGCGGGGGGGGCGGGCGGCGGS